MIRNPLLWRTNARFLYTVGCLALFGGPITISATGALLEHFLPGLESEAFNSCVCSAIFQIVLASYFLMAAATFIERIPKPHGINGNDCDDREKDREFAIDDISLDIPLWQV